jgi:hypothetical protein
MMAMKRALGLRWSPRAGHMAWGPLRCCATLWLVFYIGYTPIHLYLEPHCDDSHAGSGAAPTHGGDCVADDRHDGEEHHERHPAAEHKLKVTQPTRALVGELVLLEAMVRATPHESCPQAQVVGFSGLSPPELSCSWQFIFRAALPVRAPSFLS